MDAALSQALAFHAKVKRPITVTDEGRYFAKIGSAFVQVSEEEIIQQAKRWGWVATGERDG